MNLLTDWLGREGYLPHGYCFTWDPSLLWSMVGADATIAAAYFSIPLALVLFVRRRREPALNGIMLLFSAFIFACGTSHLVDILVIWRPDYGLQALTKLATAAISLVTAVALWRLMPRALRIPSVAQLQQLIASLEAEVQQRRRAEDHLLDTQGNLAVTLSSIGAGLIATDREGRVTSMNGVAEQITGWRIAEARGRSYWEVWNREDRPASHPTVNVVDLLIREGIDASVSTRVVALSRDGGRTPVEARAATTDAPDGTVRGMTLLFRDMSRLDQAEADASYLSAIVENSLDAIISKSLDGRITSWNRAAVELFGYQPQEAIGRSLGMLIPADRQVEEELILAQLASGLKVAPFETLRLHRSGRAIPVSVTISPVADAHGRIIGASKIVRDITEQKRLEELRLNAIHLAAENRQIQRANRLKTEFLANMSHELRTPLNAIIGFADLLQMGAVPPDSPKQGEFLGYIGSSGRHLLSLINDLLDLSKVEAGRFDFYPERLDLTATVNEVCNIVRAEAAKKGVELDIHIDASLSEVVLDAARLKQVLYNYLSNAIKFTAANGHVRLRMLAEGELNFRIEVEDDGIGISDANLSRLFVSFQQLDSGYTKRHQGTGLGLALTRRLVEVQGGSVGVRSRLGEGSVFHAVLPRRGARISHEAVEADPAAPPQLLARLLVVEHDAGIQARLTHLLSQAGYEVDGVSTSSQAMRVAMLQPYDAVTLSLLGGDGLQALVSIRSGQLNAQVPVVILTLPGGQEQLAGFVVNDVLAKPLHAAALEHALQRNGLQAGSRLMIIDDDPLALQLMCNMLERLQMRVDCQPDGRQALRELEDGLPDAIILDLVMPDFDGFAVLDALRADERMRHLPVFLWTNMVLSEVDIQGLTRSARHILMEGRGDLTALSDLLEDLVQVRSTAHGSDS
ncbi:MAG: PAS domain S-box protein [Burkholderiaceae bacterium]|nr:PAS domain S-box protein [Burkholderiaceae bacterium]